MTKCLSCGNELTNASRFCGSCGEAVPESIPAPAAALALGGPVPNGKGGPYPSGSEKASSQQTQTPAGPGSGAPGGGVDTRSWVSSSGEGRQLGRVADNRIAIWIGGAIALLLLGGALLLDLGVRHQLSATKAELTSTSSQLQTTQSDLEVTRTDRDQFESQAGDLQGQVGDLQGQLANKDSEVSSLNQRIQRINACTDQVIDAYNLYYYYDDIGMAFERALYSQACGGSGAFPG